MLRFTRPLCLSAAALLTLAGSAAQADTIWDVFATFDDQTTLSGSFTIDQYGYLTDRAITTQAGPTLAGFAYTNDNNSRANTDPTTNSPYFISLIPAKDAAGPNQPQYTAQLRLDFEHTLTDLSQLQYSIITNDKTSFECFGDFGCSAASPTGGTARYVVSGYARQASAGAAPEPATWATMLVGFGLVGASMRRPSRQRLSAACPA